MQRSIHTWHVLYLGTPRPAGEHQCFLSMGTSFAPFWLLVMGVDGDEKSKLCCESSAPSDLPWHTALALFELLRSSQAAGNG